MKDFRELLEVGSKEEANEFRMFKSIKIGKFDASIQASKYHYCEPRQTADPIRYYSMEMAIFEGKEWINPLEDGRFKGFEKELNWELGSHGVGGYIPVSTIQELCEYMEKID